MAHNISEKKKKFLKAFEEVPIVSACCNKVGVSRATLYRWLEEDYDFKAMIEKSKEKGVLFVCDLAKSKLIYNIQNNQRWAITYWLNNNDPDFMKPEKVKLVSEPQFNSIHDLVVFATQNKEIDDSS